MMKMMHKAKEKISNMASSVKEHINIGKAEVEEKLEKAAASTEEEKKLAHERKKTKEARAKMELHQDKIRHAEQRLRAKQPHYHHGHELPIKTAAPMANDTTGSTMYNLAGHQHQPTHSHTKY